MCGLPPRTDFSRGICLLVTIVQRTTNIKSWDISKEILLYPRPVLNSDRNVPIQLRPKTLQLMTSSFFFFLHGRRQLHLNTFWALSMTYLEVATVGPCIYFHQKCPWILICLLRWFLLPSPPFSALPSAAGTVPPQCKYSKILNLYPQQHSLEGTNLIAVIW